MTSDPAMLAFWGGEGEGASRFSHRQRPESVRMRTCVCARVCACVWWDRKEMILVQFFGEILGNRRDKSSIYKDLNSGTFPRGTKKVEFIYSMVFLL